MIHGTKTANWVLAIVALMLLWLCADSIVGPIWPRSEAPAAATTGIDSTAAEHIAADSLAQ